MPGSVSDRSFNEASRCDILRQPCRSDCVKTPTRTSPRSLARDQLESRTHRQFIDERHDVAECRELVNIGRGDQIHDDELACDLDRRGKECVVPSPDSMRTEGPNDEDNRVAIGSRSTAAPKPRTARLVPSSRISTMRSVGKIGPRVFNGRWPFLSLAQGNERVMYSILRSPRIDRPAVGHQLGPKVCDQGVKALVLVCRQRFLLDWVVHHHT